MRYPNEGAFVMAALQGLCTHSAAKGHYDVTDLAKRAVDIGRAAAKAHAEALDAEERAEDAAHHAKSAANPPQNKPASAEEPEG